MTQEDKELLLKDLCARLPYGVICHCIEPITSSQADLRLYGIDMSVSDKYIFMRKDGETFCHLPFEWIKPYLRPISSMTEEEFNSLKEETALNYNNQLDLVDWNNGCKTLEFWLKEIPSYVAILVFDWLNSRHFDYRALIDRGLALEAPEDMYKDGQQ